MLGEGFRSLVVETRTGVVIRIGKTPGAAAGYRMEARLLPWLRRELPVAIPEPCWYAPPSAGLPHGAIGYPKLSGTPLSPALLGHADTAPLAIDLAAFLAALHGIPGAELAAHSLRVADTPAAWESLRATVMPT